MTNREYIHLQIKDCDKHMKRSRFWGELWTWYSRFYITLMLFFTWGAIRRHTWWSIPIFVGVILFNSYTTLWKNRTRRKWAKNEMRWANIKDEWVTMRAEGELTKAWWLEEETTLNVED